MAGLRHLPHCRGRADMCIGKCVFACLNICVYMWCLTVYVFYVGLCTCVQTQTPAPVPQVNRPGFSLVQKEPYSLIYR